MMNIYLNMISTIDILYGYEIYDSAKTKVLAFIHYFFVKFSVCLQKLSIIILLVPVKYYVSKTILLV